jgi:hypothetical protein
MAERNNAALTEMQERFGVRLTELDLADLRARGRPVQDAVAAKLHLQDLLAKVRAARR